MKFFVSDAESSFTRCFFSLACEMGHSVAAAKQQSQAEEDPSQIGISASKQLQLVSWNIASVFSIRLVLRQCQHSWGVSEPTTYVIILESSIAGVSLLRGQAHEIQRELETQLYGRLLLLREIERQRAKVNASNADNASTTSNRLVFIVLEENPAIEVLGGCIYSALYHAYNQILVHSNDPDMFGFISHSNNYEAYSRLILKSLSQPMPDRKLGKWQYYKDPWFGNHKFNALNRYMK